ncbi:hypothetical protein L1987_30559 [Smallanthus sonchifolius]|uniref:Uncharacterized protein n=1 Tax=Smallanthus sonchifolius TaxID=185202 RepID=A0ACB9I3S4_9ASTR|nr:hypothetical protein L1987_30559 [Smallanthus sonchifolius]
MVIPVMLLVISIITDYFLHKLQNLPPRPWLPPLPVIGHLYLLKKPLHRTLAKLSAKNGPVQLLQSGSRPVLVISSPSSAEECLSKNDIVFANRPRLLAGKYLGYNYTSLSSYYYSRDDVLTEEEKQKAHRFQEIVTEIFKVMGAFTRRGLRANFKVVRSEQIRKEIDLFASKTGLVHAGAKREHGKL